MVHDPQFRVDSLSIYDSTQDYLDKAKTGSCKQMACMAKIRTHIAYAGACPILVAEVVLLARTGRVETELRDTAASHQLKLLVTNAVM